MGLLWSSGNKESRKLKSRVGEKTGSGLEDREEVEEGYDSCGDEFL